MNFEEDEEHMEAIQRIEQLFLSPTFIQPGQNVYTNLRSLFPVNTFPYFYYSERCTRREKKSDEASRPSKHHFIVKHRNIANISYRNIFKYTIDPISCFSFLYLFDRWFPNWIANKSSVSLSACFLNSSSNSQDRIILSIINTNRQK